VRIARPLLGSSAPVLTALQAEHRVVARLNRQGDLQALLVKKNVAVVGCGAVGSFLAEQLARSGVGLLTLVDGERLRYGNCIRHLADAHYVNGNKAQAVKDILVERDLMEASQVVVKNADLSRQNAAELFEQHDLVVDATADSRVYALLDYLGGPSRQQWVSVALHRRGNVVRVDRLGPGTDAWEERPPPVIESGDGGVSETGCGDPVSPAPPTSVIAAAALACRMVVDTLQPHARRVLPDSIVETLLPHEGEGYDSLGVCAK